MQIARKASHLRANFGEWVKIGAWVFIRIMLSTGVFLKILVLSINFFVYYIFFRQTFGHDLLLQEQSGTKNLSWHEE